MTIAPTVHDAAATIGATLEAHGIRAVFATTFRGPTIVQHAFALEAGQKVAKLEAASKDIAVALGLDDVRIVAPIPGTSYVGIEVPRDERETVTYADVASIDVIQRVGEEVFTVNGDQQSADLALPFPVGVDLRNEAVWADLAKLPHLLIAGSTGSGKSVALNSLITSLIDHRTPDEVRLWLVDPKRVELGVFERAPHVERIATDVAEAIEVLKDVVDIMDHRYELFEQVNVRNIAEWNARVEAADDRPIKHLEYHVVVIDELADLMMQAKAEVEPLIVRIAQLARAAGVHLVLATQRPVVGVVTGLIAANVVSRWVFAVRSSTDSKVALEQVGAQALYGHGDSLWLPAGSPKPIRVQGVYTDSETLARILDAAAAGGPVQSTASPRAATEDDDFDLADVGAPVEESVVEHFIGGLKDPRDQEIARENLRDLAITEDSTGLGTSYVSRVLEPSMEQLSRALGVAVESNRVNPDDIVDAPLEDPDAYNLEAQIAPMIIDIVDRALAQRDRDAKEAKEARSNGRLDRLDATWRRYVLRPALWIGGAIAAFWILGRIVGA